MVFPSNVKACSNYKTYPQNYTTVQPEKIYLNLNLIVKAKAKPAQSDRHTSSLFNTQFIAFIYTSNAL